MTEPTVESTVEPAALSRPEPPGAAGAPGLLLAIDTATRTAVVALGTADGTLVAEERWSSQHRHGAELLQHLDLLFAKAGASLDEVAAVVAGIGPGSFTGLRVGLATAKVIAYSRAVSLVAVSSLAAIAHGALVAPGTTDGNERAARVAVTLPAGSTDRYVAEVRRGRDGLPTIAKGPRLVAGGGGSMRPAAPQAAGDTVGAAAAEAEVPLLAVDLEDGEATAAALAAGRAAVERIAEGLIVIGAARLRAAETVDVAELVPAYVALPRGVTDVAAGMPWSPDLR